MQRDICPPKDRDPLNLHSLGWDDPLPYCLQLPGEKAHPQECCCFKNRWEDFLRILGNLQDVKVPRAVYPSGVQVDQRIYPFADASEEAICYVIYLRTKTSDNKIHVAFLMGSSKVIPRGVHTKGLISIPREELCTADALAQAVLQVRADVKNEITLQDVCLFTDSKDVFGWINNSTDSFPQYITNRRDRIYKVSDPSEWKWIPGSSNPADIGTRPISVQKLIQSRWIKGPEFLYNDPVIVPSEPEERIERGPSQPAPMMTRLCLTKECSPSEPEKGVMTWDFLIQEVKNKHNLDASEAYRYLLRQIQKTNFSLPSGGARGLFIDPQPNGKDSYLSSKLSGVSSRTHFFDDDGLIRGGRLERSQLTFGRKHPILIPECEEGDALMNHIHSILACHQGRVVTMATLREDPYLPVGGRKGVSRLISSCLKCRQLRALPMQQKMADLPVPRLEKIRKHKFPKGSRMFSYLFPFPLFYSLSTLFLLFGKKLWKCML